MVGPIEVQPTPSTVATFGCGADAERVLDVPPRVAAGTSAVPARMAPMDVATMGPFTAFPTQQCLMVPPYDCATTYIGV